MFDRSSCERALLAAGLIAATSFTGIGAGAAQPPRTASLTKPGLIAQHYAELPLSFEANQGQADAKANFLARGSGYSLYLTGDAAVLALCQAAQGAAGRDAGFPADRSRRSATCEAVRLQLDGASMAAKPAGEQRLPGTVNYFIGNNPAQWRTGIPTFAKVRYRNIYPGIDLVYYGNHRELEYDFVVAPGADAKNIRLRLDGATQVRRAGNGDLVVRAEGGEARFRRPEIYQVVEGRRVPVRGEFTLAGDGAVRFRLGRYDHGRPLTIDPVLEYSTYLGGSGGAVASAIAVDASGNAYVTGVALTGFPVTAGALQSADEAGQPTIDGNAFVAKLNASGTALVYATYLGGSGNATPNPEMGDGGNAIAVDAEGDAYVTGYTWSSNFPVTQGALQTTNTAAANNGSNAFVAELNPTGSALIYSTYLGGNGTPADTDYDAGEIGYGIAVDASGNAYVAGETYSTDFPVTPGALQTVNNEGQGQLTLPDGFVAKLNATGAALVYSTYLGGNGGPTGRGYGDLSRAIAVDADGNAYVTGQADSTNFPVTLGAFQATSQNSGSGINAFVTKLNPTGSAVVASTYLGGGNGDSGAAIAVDAAGNIYVAGFTGSPNFPVTAGAFQTALPGPGDGFVAKLNASTTTLIYSTYLGGSGGSWNPPFTALIAPIGDAAKGLAIDSEGDAYVVGETASTNFPVTPDAFQAADGTVQGTCKNAFLTELNPDGSGLLYSTYLGGDCNDYGFNGVGDTASGVALDGSGNVYLTGPAQSANFPVTNGAFQTAFQGSVGILGTPNAFITRFDMSAEPGTIAPTVTVAPAATAIGSAEALTVTVTVGGGSGEPVPTGTVLLIAGRYTSAATALDDGSASFEVSGGSIYGTGSLIATYVPDAASASLYGRASGSATVTVYPAIVTVTPTNATVPASQLQTQAFPVQVTVAGSNGSPQPTGTVTLVTNWYTSPAIALTAGAATITIPAGSLAPGYHSLQVNYSGDSNYAADFGMGGMTAAGPGAVTISVQPAASSIPATQPLVVAITVNAGSGNPTPLGTAFVTGGGYTSPPSAVLALGASITIPAGSLQAGTDTLTANYSGDANYEAATGTATVNVVATEPPPGFTVNGTAVTVNAGATTGNTSIISVAPSNGFTGAVNLTCAVTATPADPTSPATCAVTPSVTISGNSAQNATLTVTTTTITTAGAYAVTVTGTSGSITQTTTVNVTVTAYAAPSFALTNSGNITVVPGATTGNTSTVTVTPTGGFTGNVSLSAAITSEPTGAVNPPTLSFGSTTPAVISGANAATATLTISTTGATGCSSTSSMRRPATAWYGAGGAALACVLLFGIPARRRCWRTMLGMLLLLLALTGGVLACGGSPGGTCIFAGPADTSAGTYVITVTGTSGTATGTGTVTLTVQ